MQPLKDTVTKADKIGATALAATSGATSADLYPVPEMESREDTLPLFEQYGVNGTELDAMEFPPVQWVVPGMIPEGYGMIVAPPKAGKSWMVAGIGLAAAAGGTAFGSIPVKKRPVLYLALEDSNRRLQDRYRQLLSDATIPAGMLSVTNVPPLQSWSLIDEYAEQYRDQQPLIIVDTYQKVAPQKSPSESSYAHDYRVGSMYKEIAAKIPGGTILAVHHTNKGMHDDFQDSVSGTQGVAGAADFTLVLQRRRKSDDAILSLTGRDVIEDEYALETDGGAWSLAGRSLSAARDRVPALREEEQQNETKSRMGDNMQKIAEFVNGSGESVLTTADVKAHFTDMEDNSIRQNLARAVRSGLIRRESRGVYSPL